MLSMPNDEDSKTEQLWLTMRQADSGKLLVIIHTYQEVNANTANVRLISARPATKHEQHQYEVNQ